MDNQTLKSQFFRSISVHLRELHVLAPFSGAYLFTLDVCFQIFQVYPFSRTWTQSAYLRFSEHIRSFFPPVSVSFVLVS